MVRKFRSPVHFEENLVCIENLDELIFQYTGPTKTILNKDIEEYTQDGENHCSLLLKIDVTLKVPERDGVEVLHIIAKCMKKTRSAYFNHLAPLLFKKEIAFYTEIVPVFESLVHEYRLELIDLFPKLLAYRRNLNSNDEEIDEHAVILLENLFEDGYSHIKRQDGFNLEGAEQMIKRIATFHAIPVVLKILKPDVFESKVKKYALLVKEFKEAPKGKYQRPVFLKIMEEQEELKAFVGPVEKELIETFKNDTFYDLPCTEPNATIVHTDLSINNTMQKMAGDRILQNMIIDFQSYQYGNPMLDVIFFLFTSVQRGVLEENFEHFINIYEDRFFNVFRGYNCDTSGLRRNFLEQAAEDAPKKLIHILFRCVPIFSKKGDFADDYDAEPSSMIKETCVTQEARDHIEFVLKEYKKRGWFKFEQ